MPRNEIIKYVADSTPDDLFSDSDLLTAAESQTHSSKMKNRANERTQYWIRLHWLGVDKNMVEVWRDGFVFIPSIQTAQSTAGTTHIKK